MLKQRSRSRPALANILLVVTQMSLLLAGCSGEAGLSIGGSLGQESGGGTQISNTTLIVLVVIVSIVAVVAIAGRRGGV